MIGRVGELLELAVAMSLLVLESVLRSVLWLLGSLPIWPRRKLTEADRDYDRSATQLIKSRGYPVEEHWVTTKDGYILGLQRIPHGRVTPVTRMAAAAGPAATASASYASDGEDEGGVAPGSGRPVVFVLHGFMQSSEAFLCRSKAEDALPLVLADRGYDVWLGNCRGNKYSHKHVTLSPGSDAFWDFSLDQLILYDVPAMLEYVLRETGAATLSYVGFSQGTALAFGAFAVHRELARRVRVLVALASTAHVARLNNPILDAVVRARPEMVFRMFGRRSFLDSSLVWRRFIAPALLVLSIDLSNRLLFGWRGANIDPAEKPLMYSHLYSFSSVKMLVHWFQIMRTRRFQMFDDLCATNPGDDSYHPYELPTFQLNKIPCPMVLFYGGCDSLPDVDATRRMLPKSAVIHREEPYEHLDFQWARDLRTRVFPVILDALAKHADAGSDSRTKLE